MLQELISLTASPKFKEDGALTIVAVRRMDGDSEKYDLELDLKLKLGDDDDCDSERWAVVCSGVRKHQIVLDEATSFRVHEDHPLLWEDKEDLFNLRLDNRTWDGAAIVDELRDVHRDLTGDWIPFLKYFNYTDIAEGLCSRDAKLASGPKTPLTAYQKVLREYDIESSLSLRSLSAENGEPNAVLLTIDETFVVAAKFEARKQG